MYKRQGLEGNTLVPITIGAGVVGINTRDDYQTILDLFLHARQPTDVVTDSLFIVGGARTDHNQEFVRLAGDDILYSLIFLLLDLLCMLCLLYTSRCV